MQLRRTTAILLRQSYLVRGSVARLVPLFVWVAIDIVLWGFITRYLATIAAPGVELVPQLLGAVLLWDFLVRVMQGVTTTFFEDVWSRNFLNLFATPLTLGEYLGGLVLSSIATSAIGLAVMLTLATTVFGLSFLAMGPGIVAFLLVLFVFGIALGIVGSAVVLRLGPSAEWFVWPIPALVSPFAGVFYPISVLPGWMQAVAHALPPSYVFEGVRALVAGGAVSGAALAIGLALALAWLGVACWLFARIFRFALRAGLIARYNAETTG